MGLSPATPPGSIIPPGARGFCLTIADSTACYRVLETSHPPVWYVPPGDIRTDLLIPEAGASFCEFKGRAVYWTLRVNGAESKKAAWSYPDPTHPFAPIRDYLAIYPSRVEACYVDEERVTAQPGDFYGGWITSDVAGPFKGGAGTAGW